MMVVCTDGYLLSVLCPHLTDSRKNDASVLKGILEPNTEDMKNWLKEDDSFVVDRGFRDYLEIFRVMKYIMTCLIFY